MHFRERIDMESKNMARIGSCIRKGEDVVLKPRLNRGFIYFSNHVGIPIDRQQSIGTSGTRKLRIKRHIVERIGVGDYRCKPNWRTCLR